MKKILILFTLVFIFSCSDEKESVLDISDNAFAEVIISGKIKNRSSDESIKTVNIYISDILADEKFKIERVAIEDSGKFKASLLIDRAQSLSLNYKDVSFNLLVKKNDSIHVVFNDSYKTEKAVFDDAVITGTAIKINKDLFKFLRGRDYNSSAYYERLKKSNPSDYKIFHDSLYRADGDYIDKFSTNNDLDQVLKDWLFVEKHYLPADNLLGFPLYFQMFNPEAFKTAEYSEDFYSDLDNLPELKTAHLVNPQINGFGNYLRFHYYKKLRPEGEKIDSKTLDSIGIRALKKDFANNPLVLQLAVYDIINSSLENNNLDFLNNEEKFIEDLYSESIFESVINTRKETVLALLNNPEISKSTELLEFNYDTAQAFINDLVKNANDKIIYIDNWAVWCAPCRSEFKEATPLLKKKFSKKVEFVYICHQSEEKLWKPMIAQYNLEGKHYFVTDEQNKMLSEYLKITGYPNYNIIDKTGKMLYHGFEYRPSESITTELLTKLTK